MTPTQARDSGTLRGTAPVRLLLLIGGLHPAGAEQQARLLLEHLPRARVRPVLACFQGPEDVLSALRDSGVDIHLLPRPQRRTWPLQLLRHLHGLVQREDITVVHAFLPDLAILAVGLRALVPGLHVVTGRRSLDEYLPSRQLWFLRASAPWTSTVVANAHAVAESVRAHEGWLGRCLRVIPNALPLPSEITPEERTAARQAFALEPGDFVIGYPAHFRHHKGHDHLPEIARLAGAKVPRLVFLLAGDTSGNSDYRRNYARFLSEIEALGVDRHFRYAGMLSGSRQLLAASDLAANFSDLEGMSNTVMESMAAELPIIATAVGGTPELVQNGRHGWLVARGDRTAAAERIVRLASDPEERARMGCEGRSRIEKEFSIERMVDAYARLYEELAGRKPRHQADRTRAAETDESTSHPGTDPAGAGARPVPPALRQRVRNTARWVAAVGVNGLGLSERYARARRLGGRWAVVLRYHRVIPASEPYSYYRIGVSEEQFRQQMEWLAGHHRVCPFEEVLWWIHAGITPPEDLVALTFDDGYLDNLTCAAPVLSRLGLPALFYVASSCLTERMPFWTEVVAQGFRMTSARALDLTGEPDCGSRVWPLGSGRMRQRACLGLIGSLHKLPAERITHAVAAILAGLGVSDERARAAAPPVMKTDHLRSLAGQGFDIGSHTVSHPYLPAEPEPVRRRELIESRAMLEDAAGVRVRDFCYPVGGYDEELIRLVRESGYRSATTTELRVIGRGDDPYRLGRLGIGSAIASGPDGRFSAALMDVETSFYFRDRFERRKARA